MYAWSWKVTYWEVQPTHHAHSAQGMLNNPFTSFCIQVDLMVGDGSQTIAETQNHIDANAWNVVCKDWPCWWVVRPTWPCLISTTWSGTGSYTTKDWSFVVHYHFVQRFLLRLPWTGFSLLCALSSSKSVKEDNNNNNQGHTCTHTSCVHS